MKPLNEKLGNHETPPNTTILSKFGLKEIDYENKQL
jgi:hypothetical protein